MSPITTSSSSAEAARRITRFRQPEPTASESGSNPINRSLLSERVRGQIDRVRRDDTLAWMAHSVWLSGWSVVVASLFVLFAVGGCAAVLLNDMSPLVAEANPHLVILTVGCAFGLALAAGAMAYGATRSRHPSPIRQGRRIHGPVYGLVVAGAVALLASLLAMPWSFPRLDVLRDSAHEVSTLAADHQIVHGTMYQEPSESSLYFETTIGAWIVTPITTLGSGSTYDQVMQVAGPRPVAGLSTVARAIGSGQVAALRNRVAHLWELAAALCFVAIGVCALQRRLWNKPILAPPIDDHTIHQILAVRGDTK